MPLNISTSVAYSDQQQPLVIVSTGINNVMFAGREPDHDLDDPGKGN